MYLPHIIQGMGLGHSFSSMSLVFINFFSGMELEISVLQQLVGILISLDWGMGLAP